MAGADLVAAHYPTTNPNFVLSAYAGNATQSNIAPRTNLVWGVGNLTDGALTTSGVMNVVAVPVENGDVFTKISINLGATAISSPTHSFAALYAGTPGATFSYLPSSAVLLAQSTDLGSTGTYVAKGQFTWTLSSAVTVTTGTDASPATVGGPTTTNAPYGYLYAAFSFTTATQPTALCMATPAGINYAWYANGPVLSLTAGSGVGAAGPNTLTGCAIATPAPVVWLS